MTDSGLNTRPSIAQLSYKHIGPASGRRVWVLHGIMGSKQNWSRFTRRLSERHPEIQITSVDLRCHGETPHLDGPHRLLSCAYDLRALGDQIGHPQTIIGHSFGGKVALQYAALYASSGVSTELERVWTLDSPLAARRQAGHDEVARVIEACGAIPMPQPSRQAVTEHFTQRGFSLGIAQWMTTNLRRVSTAESESGGFTWRFDLAGISALISDYWEVDGWSLLAEISPDVSLNLLRAERGMRWTEGDAARITEEFAHINTPLLSDSGHWVHIEQLEGLLELLGAL